MYNLYKPHITNEQSGWAWLGADMWRTKELQTSSDPDSAGYPTSPEVNQILHRSSTPQKGWLKSNPTLK